MSHIYRKTAAALAWLPLVAFVPVSALAHVSLSNPTAEQGSYHRASFQVGHGCAGSPTVSLAVWLPTGVSGVRPSPKAGWQLDIEPASGGDVQRVVWRGGSLDDRHFDEFVMRFKVTAAPGPLWFRVEQVCAQGRNDWAAVPASGTDTRGIAFTCASLIHGQVCLILATVACAVGVMFPSLLR